MRVQCILCDAVHELDDNSPEAKKLRNKPLHTYMCVTCHERITAKTERHHKRMYGQNTEPGEDH